MYAFNAATSSCIVPVFMQLFQKFVQSMQFPTFIPKLLNSFFLLYNL